MYINTFKYTPKDVSCQLCTEYVKKLGCTALRCPWLAERIEAGVVGYREAVMETFPRDRRLSSRLNLLIKHYPGSLWSNEQHERRMQYQCAVQGYRRRRDTNAYYAAMYLLTSNDDIYRRTANCFCKDGIEFGYSSEAQHQKVRLESIGLFEHIDFDPGKCPLCSGTLENPLPSVEMIRTSIVNLDKSIANVTREQPKLRAFISTLEQERQKKQEEIRALEAEIDGIYQQEDERARLRDINARKGKVIGRISLWVESVQNDTESEQQEQVIREIEKRVQEIDSILDTDSVDERKQSALSRIQEDMTKWAKELQLEHCDNPYRLDLNKVTVIVDKPERPVPLKQLGSGSNWVGVHLIAYFALQHYFIGAKRPVPRFMFLDQPSQVYFPSEFDEKKTDWNEVNKIYQFVIDRTTELQGQLQVIIVDHADLKKDSFREFIRENWWPDDKNLVPIDWYKSE